jgi:hypothetical protein
MDEMAEPVAERRFSRLMTDIVKNFRRDNEVICSVLEFLEKIKVFSIAVTVEAQLAERPFIAERYANLCESKFG